MKSKKPFKSIDEQIQLLTSRGLILDVDARHYLQQLNYYRLSGYWRPFQEDSITHRFKSGTKFSDVINLYTFDREFRLLLLDAIERIEVSVRTQWAYYFAESHGPLAHLDCRLSNNVHWHAQNIFKLQKEVERSGEKFIKHFLPDDPPIWAVCEVMSFGLMSKWLTSLKPGKVRSKISKTYNIDYEVLNSFIIHLAYLRNLSAHHSRVWNRNMTKTMEIPSSKPQSLITNFNFEESSVRKIYNTLVMIMYLLDIISPGNSFRSRFLNLVRNHSINVIDMGFSDDWQSKSIWVN